VSRATNDVERSDEKFLRKTDDGGGEGGALKESVLRIFVSKEGNDNGRDKRGHEEDMLHSGG